MNCDYDKYPYVAIAPGSTGCEIGWGAIMTRLHRFAGGRIICIECYPGVFEDDICRAIEDLDLSARIIRSRCALKTPAEIEALLARDLTDDPVFGHLTCLELKDFLAYERLENLKETLQKTVPGPTFVVGTGATLLCEGPDVLVYADLARWEIQQRQRRNEVANLGATNESADPSAKYKRGFFVDWRVADRFKAPLLPRIDFLLDTNKRHEPKMISGEMLRKGLSAAVRQPFRVVPFFDPGPWGGQWLRKTCCLPSEPPNYAWCFDCVPEENSLLLGFGNVTIEVPALDLVLSHPRELLGDAVHARFGTEFPIRFDFLDTMEGGNLSLQVHPLTEYIQEQFGVHYTQDESYYLLDAGDDACVYLGLKEQLDRESMIRELQQAQNPGNTFSAERYANVWPAKKHDHFLIPAGTIHCSGRNCVVLEISATPYIFTFKLWDWGRLGMDGRPRPIHLEHGIQNVQWDRTTAWVERELVNRVEQVAQSNDWQEERTGLHEREFIETRRHWFSGAVRHNTSGSVNVLNLVEGSEIVVESPSGAFQPMHVHFAETFVVPAAVGSYIVRPAFAASKSFATIKASVRTGL
jgi:mannose-6-phosphate isomerase class I